MSNQINKKCFVLWHDTLSVINELSDEQAGKLIREILQYSINLNNPNEPKKPSGLSGLMSAVFHPFQMQLDREFEAYLAKCKKNAENGKKGGRPTNKKTQRKPKNPNTDTDTDTDTDTINYPEWILQIDGLKEKINEYMKWRKKVNKRLSISQQAYNYVFNDLGKLRDYEHYNFDLIKSIDFAMIKKGWQNLEFSYFINLLEKNNGR